VVIFSVRLGDDAGGAHTQEPKGPENKVKYHAAESDRRQESRIR
jgi:hypothetical protein